MKTRTADPDTPLSQERYMSSREFTELRGVSGVAVAARASILTNVENRKLIWFLQGMSIKEGGLKKIANDLLAMFPERIGTPKMHKLGIKPGKMVEGNDVSSIYMELGVFDYSGILNFDAPQRKPVSIDSLLSLCKTVAIGPRNRRREELSIEEFLIDLCINPTIQIRTGSEASAADEIEMDLVKDRYRDLDTRDFKAASVSYFRDIVGALIEYKRHCEQAAKEGFVLTSVGRKIWQTLDFALATGNMVLLDGLEGRGKTEAVKA